MRKGTILVLFLLLFAFKSSAYDFEYNGLCYNIISTEDRTVELTYRDFIRENYTLDELDEEITIPQSVVHNGTSYRVVSMGDSAFYGCFFTSVVLPDGITSIGKNAFSVCRDLSYVELPNSLTFIGDSAFSHCGLTSVTIPGGIKTVNSSIFIYCPLKSVTMLEGIVSIGKDAFSYGGLESVTFPTSLISIGDNAFSTCTKLTSIKLPDNLAIIGNTAFEGCSSLKTINIPESVSEIGEMAFYGCFELDSIIIPGVSDIKQYTFAHCTSLKSVIIKEGTTIINGAAFLECTNLESVSLPGSLSTIESYAFSGCTGLDSIRFPNGLTTINVYAFENCSALKEITVPASVTDLKTMAFSGCDGIETLYWNSKVSPSTIIKNKNSLHYIYFGDSVTSIGGLGDCQQLWIADIPEGAKTIENGAFSGCIGLSYINIPEGVTRIGNYAFDGCYSLTAIDIPPTITSIGMGAFENCTGLSSIDVSGNNTSIGDNAFKDCRNLKNITLEGATNIGNNVFMGCNIRTISIPHSAIYIGSYTFEGCSKIDSLYWNSNVSPNYATKYCHDNLKYVLLGDSITTIGESAFYQCAGLKTIVIPESVITIGPFAFGGCTGLTSVNIPKNVNRIDNNSFSQCINIDTIYWAPNNSDYLYNVTWPCCNNLKHVVLGNNVSNIGEKAFKDCVNISSITLPDNVTSIDDYAFYGCSGLSSIIIPKSVMSIGSYSFEGCSRLTSIAIPESVTSLNNNSFRNDTCLKSVSIPHSIIAIGNKVFDGCVNIDTIYWNSNVTPNYITYYCCNNLKYAEIGDSVSVIGSYAFSGCTSLTSLIIPPSVTSIYGNAFSECSNLSSLELPDGIEIIGDLDFRDCIGLTNIVIPGSISDIKESAFSGCSNLTSVTIQNGTKRIYDNAFANCRKLSFISIPYSVSSVYSNAFSGCTSIDTIYWDSDYSPQNVIKNSKENLKHVILGNTITTISNSAFSGCTKIRHLEIPENITTINSYAFDGCRNLTYVSISAGVSTLELNSFNNCSNIDTIFWNSKLSPKNITQYCKENLSCVYLGDSVTSIDNNAFYECGKLAYISLPESLISIGRSAFEGCSILKLSVIPSSVVSIGSNAFSGCIGIKSLVIPHSVTSIEYTSFSGCVNIDTLYWNSDVTPYNVIHCCKDNLQFVLLGDSITTVGSNAFNGWTNLTSIVIPKNVTSIGANAFKNCTGLSSIILPEGLFSIGSSAFYGCTNLSSIAIPKGVDNIESQAFYGCTGLTDLYVLSNVANIGNQAFDGCSNIKALSWNSNVSPYCVSQYCKNSLETLVLGDSITTIRDNAFKGCANIKSILISQNVTTIGSNAFNGCIGLKKILIPYSVESIDNTAFSGDLVVDSLFWNSKVSPQKIARDCNVKHVILGNNVTTIPDETFSYCRNMLSVQMDSVKSIGAIAFGNCTGLTTLTIPKCAVSISLTAFKGCTEIDTIYWESSAQPSLITRYCNSNLKFIQLGEETKQIHSEDINGCVKLESIVIPKSVIYIYDGAFADCSSLRSITVDDDNYEYDSRGNCNAIIEKTTNTLVAGCMNTIIPESVARISSHAFEGCKGLTSIRIPEHVTSIGDDAFQKCSGLVSIESNPLTPPSLGQNVFTDTLVNKVSLSMPYESYEIYSSNENWNQFGKYYTIEGLYDLSYYVDGALYSKHTLHFDSLTTHIAEPIKEGYTFSGWSELPQYMPERNIDVSGTFGINSYKLSYLIDSIEYKSFDVVFKDTLPKIMPTKEGYTFMGWSAIPDSMPARDVYVNGSFSINSYILTYKVDGLEYLKDTLDYATAITPLAALTKVGYTFSGWSDIPATMPAQDVEIIGTFSINSYILTYKVDGADYKKDTLVYNTAITPLAALSKVGYTFSGWSDIPATMPANNVDITSSFSINSYILTYKVDGLEYLKDTLDYATAITPLAALTKIGHTFSGWSDIPETMPAQNVEVTGSFSINSYILTYKIDGTDYKKDTLAFNTAIAPLAALTKVGYTFSGWSDIPETMPAQDVEVTGSFSINSYILTYKIDGTDYKKDTLDYAAAISPLAALTKVGYTFSGWSDIPATMPAQDVEITGSFSINSYILTYKVEGADYKKDTLVYNTAITPLAAPTQIGYTFSGWSEIPATMPAQDVEVTGSFSINSYILTYKIDGTDYKKDTLAFNTAIAPLAALTKVGYTFSGWSDIPETMPAQNVEVTGSFSINSYILTYKIDGTDYKKDTLAFNTAIAPLAALTKVGYTFSGWSDIPATMPAQDVEIIGTFSINSYILTYKVDGADYKKDTLVYNTAITPLAALSKVGYTFSGWSDIPATMPANNVDITSSFSINSYILTYKVDGVDYLKDTLDYATDITPLAALTKVGHTFFGWSDIPETMPAQNVEVTGSFSINSYILTYKVDGVDYLKDTLDYATDITPLAALTKVGYTFSGWSDIPATMPAQDVEIIGTFSINSYILTYKVDGADYKKDTLVYNTAITPLAALSKVGYTFSGWSDIPATMPANDVEVAGTFTVNRYRLTVLVADTVYYSDSIAYGTKLADYVTLIEEKGIDLSQWELYGLIETITMPAYDVQIKAVVTKVKPILKYADESAIYDLTGKKIHTDDITTLPAGIYIRNGRKFQIQ